jgi:hypothetical protein
VPQVSDQPARKTAFGRLATCCQKSESDIVDETYPLRTLVFAAFAVLHFRAANQMIQIRAGVAAGAVTALGFSPSLTFSFASQVRIFRSSTKIE